MESDNSSNQPFAPAIWKRGIYMLICAFLYNVAEMVVVAVALLQFLFKLFGGSENQQLKRLGQGISIFFYQTMRFLTFNSEEKPFPFSPWPDIDDQPALDGARNDRRNSGGG